MNRKPLCNGAQQRLLSPPKLHEAVCGWCDLQRDCTLQCAKEKPQTSLTPAMRDPPPQQSTLVTQEGTGTHHVGAQLLPAPGERSEEGHWKEERPSRHTRHGSISTPALPREKRGSAPFPPAPCIPPATREPPAHSDPGYPSRTHGSRDSGCRIPAVAAAATAPLPPLRALTCGLVTGGRPRAGRGGAGRAGEGGARGAAGTTRDRGRRRGERYVPSHTRRPWPSRACVGVPVGAHAPARDRVRVRASSRSGASVRVCSHVGVHVRDSARPRVSRARGPGISMPSPRACP